MFNNTLIKSHAERDAILKIEKLIKNNYLKSNKSVLRVNVIVLRVNGNNELCESAPCENCTKALSKCKYIKINKLFF